MLLLALFDLSNAVPQRMSMMPRLRFLKVGALTALILQVEDCGMDARVWHKGLKRLFEQDDSGGVNPEHVANL